MKAFKSVVVFAVIALCTPLFMSARESVRIPGNDYWFILKQAQNAYEANDYGKALSLAEQAKQNKKKVSDWENSALEQTQKSSKVRKTGDFLSLLLPVLKEKNYTDAVDVINQKVKQYGSDFFEGRFSVLRNWVKDDYLYPEADFLIGKIYKLEGELDMSSDYLNRAYANIGRLDVPDVKYDILYELADLAEFKNDGNDYEQKLLAVLTDDKLYTDKDFMNALLRIVKGNKVESVEKFFLLYRSENDISIPALEKLADYYLSIGQTDKALSCSALGCIASVTKIEDILKNRISDYSYTEFTDLLVRASAYNDIIVWGNENNIWKLLFTFASNVRSCNQLVFANTLFEKLSKYEPEAFWRNKAKNSIIVADKQ